MSFRLAAVSQDRVYLYQAWRSAWAKAGGDLWAIAGKVRAIDVQRGEPAAGAPARRRAITSPPDVEALVAMIVRGAMRRRAPRIRDARYCSRSGSPTARCSSVPTTPRAAS